ncbi:hypothetical protein [Bacillus sp. KH172YL63]|uniref:hypothetical protein n=1 Tax=Bacillus sp. KH172YL63 TaxID=2709784 RepID=UPI0013E4A51D|nr:hypothetical protein [Bacillus sp. KH172YL63]BCB03947.1 hypothetical protein KH172YL63_20800 [Bacillus sp. KH172YL63]
MYWLIDLVESFIQVFQNRQDRRNGKVYKSSEEKMEEDFISFKKDTKVFLLAALIVITAVICAIFLL